jgi:2-oxoglutarate ferredoxin oxidoreductase subunit beta
MVKIEDFGILRALGRALVELEIPPHQVLLVSGIGQAGKLPHYMRGNVLNELHGRAVPAATAAKIANHELTVIAVSGDGDGYGEGGNHWIAAMHRNVDMTYIVHNNQIYGLTKGQASPTSDLGFVTKTTPLGAGPPINPMALAIASDASFVGRGFAGDPAHLGQLMKMGIKHRGFALIDVLQPCVAFNHKNTYQWYRERVYKLDEEDGYDPSDKLAAFDKAQEWGDRIPIGVIYRKERATFEEQIPALKKGVLVKQKHDPKRVKKLFEEFL